MIVSSLKNQFGFDGYAWDDTMVIFACPNTNPATGMDGNSFRLLT